VGGKKIQSKNFVQESLVPACISEFKKEGKGYFIWCNKAFLDLLGYDEKELFESSWEQFIVEDGRTDEKERARKELRDVQSGRKENVYDYINKYRRKDDEIVVLSWRTTLSSEGSFYSQVADVTGIIGFEGRGSQNNNVIEQIFSAKLAQKIANTADEQDRVFLGAELGDAYFTPRELDVFRQIIKGKTAKQIAKTLGITPRTAESHTNNIKQKMRCMYKNEIITKALKNGLALF
jgi:PAS domain S-box-containing protein